MTDVSQIKITRQVRQAVKQRHLFSLCEASLVSYVSMFGKVVEKGTGRVLPMDFEDRPFQISFLEEVEEHDRIVMLKGRQIGFTSIMAWLMHHTAAFSPNAAVIYGTVKQDEGRRIMREIRNALVPSLPDWMNRKLPRITNDAVDTILLENGSYIELRATQTGDLARGVPSRLIYADEFASYKRPEDTMSAVLPSVADGGTLILGGTMKLPEGTMFKDIWQAADRGESDFRALFYGWRSVLSRDDEWYETELRRLKDPTVMVRENPTSPEEAFTYSGRLVFDPDALAEMEEEADSGARGTLVDDRKNWTPEDVYTPKFESDPNGDLVVWTFPDKCHGNVVIGVDACHGVRSGDYGSVVVLSVDTGKILAEWHGKADPHNLGPFVNLLGRWYRDAFVCVERNGPGETVLSKLIDLAYPAIYRDIKRAAVGNSLLSTLGWHTNVQSKQVLIDSAVEAVASGWLRIPSVGIIREMRGYVRDDDGKMAGSPYDDRVIGTALACMMVRFVGDPEAIAAPQKELVPWSLEWWDFHDQHQNGRQRDLRSKMRRRKHKMSAKGKMALLPEGAPAKGRTRDTV